MDTNYLSNNQFVTNLAGTLWLIKVDAGGNANLNKQIPAGAEHYVWFEIASLGHADCLERRVVVGNSNNLQSDTLPMSYSLDHFMGQRYALFFYSTKEPGGYADFDWFKISE
ncbi:MAG: hypothetical protein IKW77_03190 [Salinivirgaceae bacterium]|nr:hypothetical protein [Salinivirgaceae bacterium]